MYIKINFKTFKKIVFFFLKNKNKKYFLLNKLFNYFSKNNNSIKNSTLKYKIKLSIFSLSKLIFFLIKLKKNFPIEYLIKNIYFLNNKFFINKNCLIPRIETEELLKYILFVERKNLKLKKNILDLGAGSGVLGLSLALNSPTSNIYLSDISKKCISIINKNKIIYSLNNVKVIHSNWLSYFLKNNIKFDLIVSNPPYILINDKNVCKKTYKYEPKLAFFNYNKDNIYYYTLVINNLNKILNKNGIIYLEINEFLYHELSTYLKKIKMKKFKTISYFFLKDLYNKYRYLIIKN